MNTFLEVTQFAQYYLGAISFVFLCVIAQIVALSIQRWCIYGRATLIYIGIASGMVGAARLIYGAGLISIQTNRNLNDYTVIPCAVAVGSLVILHLWTHHEEKRHRA